MIVAVYLVILSILFRVFESIVDKVSILIVTEAKIKDLIALSTY